MAARRLADAGTLPSYQDATTRPDWLDLVALYIPIRQYARLCLVSRRFYHQFAPRLWNDPLAVICLLNPDYSYADPECFLGFLGHAAGINATGSSLPSFVRTLDTPRLFANSSALVQSAFNTQPLSKLLFSCACSFPQLRCILLDGYPGLEPEGPANLLSSDRLPPFEPPLLLSISRCQVELPPSFFASGYLRSLVYLDVSDMPGSLKPPLVQRTLSAANLPSLRILKAQGREMDNATARLLFMAFWEQLWSVDLSRNRLSDDSLEDMHHYSFPSQTSRTSNPAVEGRLMHLSGGMGGSSWFGAFCLISESPWSATYRHPDRYLADPPFYTPLAEDGPSPSVRPRLNGRVKIRPDSPDAIKTMFSGNAGCHGPPLESVRELDICRDHQGITHLYLNSNNISAFALAKMIRLSPGQLQHLECDSLSFKLPGVPFSSWLSKARLSGTLGWAHEFRPVFSANLQVLRIHHSLVTQLLSLELDGLSPLASWWVAETQLLPRAELAYPEAFVPDMNARLQSLILTRIPRYSTGPLIEKLINFLKLASVQERAIQEVEIVGRRAPATLLGLRHIRLEFEPDPREEMGRDVSDGEFDIDAAAIMDDHGKEFSFFGESSWSSTRPSSTSTVAAPKHVPRPVPHSESRNTPAQSARPASPRPASLPSETPPSFPETHPQPQTSTETDTGTETGTETETETETETHTETQHTRHTWTWNAAQITRPVWIGPRLNSPESKKQTPAVREYMRLVRVYPEQLQCDPVPASPCHVAAGVPGGELVFSKAWEAILFPPLSSSGASIEAGGTNGGGGGGGGGSSNTTTNNRNSTNTSSSSITSSSKSRSSSESWSRSSGSDTTPSKPTRADLRGMKDVIAAIKEYRAQTRRAYGEVCRLAREQGKKEEEVKLGEPHFHWMGRLEVLVMDMEEGEGRGFWR